MEAYKKFIIQAHLIELSKLIDDNEIALLKSKYIIPDKDLINKSHCTKCGGNIPVELMVYDYKGQITIQCIDCRDRMTIKTKLINDIKDSLPSPIKKRSLSYEKNLKGIDCDNCTVSQPCKKCKYSKRYDLMEKIEALSLDEHNKNEKLASSVVTDDIVNMRLISLKLNRRINQIKKEI